MTSDVFRPVLTYLVPTSHVRQFLPYNVQYLETYLDPPTYSKIGRHLWTFPNDHLSNEPTMRSTPF